MCLFSMVISLKLIAIILVVQNGAVGVDGSIPATTIAEDAGEKRVDA